MHKIGRVEFLRKVGRSGRIALPYYVIRSFQGRIVRVIIEPLDEGD